MLQNHLILEKIDEKTKEDPVMREFIENIFDVEVQNKQFRTPYLNYIESSIKKEENKK